MFLTPKFRKTGVSDTKVQKDIIAFLRNSRSRTIKTVVNLCAFVCDEQRKTKSTQRVTTCDGYEKQNMHELRVRAINCCCFFPKTRNPRLFINVLVQSFVKYRAQHCPPRTDHLYDLFLLHDLDLARQISPRMIKLMLPDRTRRIFIIYNTSN